MDQATARRSVYYLAASVSHKNPVDFQDDFVLGSPGVGQEGLGMDGTAINGFRILVNRFIGIHGGTRGIRSGNLRESTTLGEVTNMVLANVP